MSLIKIFCKENNIDRKIVLKLFNILNTISKSKKDNCLLIQSIFKDCILSGTIKKEVESLLIYLNNILSNKYFEYKDFNFICEICPCLSFKIATYLRLSIKETKKSLHINKILVNDLINTIILQSKKYPF